MTSRNQVRVEIVGDASSLKGAVNQAKQEGGGLSDTFKKYAGEIKAFMAVKAAQAIKDFVFSAKDSFSNLEQAVGGTEAVFGDSSGVIDDYAEGAAESIGLAESAFRVATTGIGGQLKRMTGDVDFAADRSIFLTEVAADLAATYGGTTADAVMALSAAFRGEADPAERFNLNLKVSKVNAKAVELGLAATTKEVDDNARAQALLALITEQSADALGQFARESDTIAGKEQILNAQLEDQKALLGESIAPLYLDLLGIAGDLVPVIGTLASGISVLTGSLDMAAQAAKNFEKEHGRTPETAREVTDAIIEEANARHVWIESWTGLGGPLEHATTALRENIEATDMSRDEVLAHIDAIKDAGKENRLTAAQVEYLTGILRGKLIPTAQDTVDHAQSLEGELAAIHGTTSTLADVVTGEGVPSLEALAFAEERAKIATDAAKESAIAQMEAIRNLHNPMLRAIELAEAAEIASGDLGEAVRKYGANSDEAREAAKRLLNANSELTQIMIDLKNDGIDPTGAAARNMFNRMGVPHEVIDAIFAAFEGLAEDIEGLNPLMTVDMFLNAPTGPGASYTTGDSGGTVSGGVDIGGIRHSGGVVNAPRGREVLARVLGGETIGNPNYPGSGHGDGGGAIVNLDGRTIARVTRDRNILMDRYSPR